MASEPTRERFKQRTDPQGVRLVRTGMEEGVVLADIANAIRHHDLTLSELRAILDEGHPPASPVPSVEATDRLREIETKLKAVGRSPLVDSVPVAEIEYLIGRIRTLDAEREVTQTRLGIAMDATNNWRCECGGFCHRELDQLRSALRSEAEPSEDTVIKLTESECEAVSAFYSYGATRGNHSHEGRGPMPGPLTPHIHAMGTTARKVYEARAARSSSPEDPNGK